MMTIPNIFVAPDIKNLLPDVLIDYLCDIASSGEYKKFPVQTFALAAGELGGQIIQDIRHLEKRLCVFGFPPVNCKLRVLNDNGRYQMVLD